MKEQIPNLYENHPFDEDIDTIGTFSNFEDFADIFNDATNLKAHIIELLDTIGINEDNYEQYRQANCDFWNDLNSNGHSFRELANQWANSQKDVYNSKLWQNAIKFIEFEDAYFDWYGYEYVTQAMQEGGLTNLLMQIQCVAYYQFACKVLALIAELPTNNPQ